MKNSPNKKIWKLSAVENRKLFILPKLQWQQQ